jgi:cyclophilin family peptidyl-prolyl cis-trans isomerase
MMRSCLAILCVVLSAAVNSLVFAADDASKSAADDYQRIKAEFTSLRDAIAQTQAKMTAATDADQPAERQKYSDLVSQFSKLLPRLQVAAEKAYEADASNREAADLLYTIAVNDLRMDRYEDAEQIAKLLIANNYPKKEIYRIAASAAFPQMHLADARKYLQALGEEGARDPSVQQLAGEIDRYQSLWDQEQKIRQAEAKADLPRVKFQTSAGDIVVELFENEAPNTVANFISLVEKGFYNGTQFHRVLPGFMAQGGDPLSKEPEKNAGKIGGGGPGYTIACECYEPNRRTHFRGSLSMAHAGKDTGGSQFFLTFGPTGNLDGKHTVFGRVIEGMDVLGKIQRVDPQQPNPSIIPDRIIKAEVIRKRNHPYEPKTIAKK